LIEELYCLGVGTARQELAEAERGSRADRAAIYREHLFKFGNAEAEIRRYAALMENG
jgi:hypothetical protein